jgi:hypothetical protein
MMQERGVDKQGRPIDFMLSDRRNPKAAHRFVGKAPKIMRNWTPSSKPTMARGFKSMRTAYGHDQGHRDPAHDPPRPLHVARAGRIGRGPLRQQALRHRSLTKEPLKD